MNDNVDELLNQVRLLYNRIVQVGEALHEDEAVTLGMRAVLEFLVRQGPTTVPDIARSRGVTRQHIQTLVNALQDEGLIRLEDNPRHKRSSLVKLTAEGERVMRRMKKREARYFANTRFGAGAAEIAAAADTLEKVRRSLRDPES